MSFDLNIDNYTFRELCEMFDLPSDFDKNIFEIKEVKLRENILKNKDISKDTRVNTLNFLVQARNILLNEQPAEPKASPVTTILKDVYNSNFKLSKTKLEDSSEHMVQDRTNQPYLSSYPSQYFPCVINPIKKKTTIMNLNIDSKFRDNYFITSSTNYNVTLPIQISNVLSMSLSDIEIPTTFYNVSKQFGSNFFTVTLTDTGESRVVTINDGNYNQSGLINSINNELVLLGGNFANIIFIININDGNGSGQTMVGCALDASFNFELNFQANRFGDSDTNTPLPLKLGWILGFRNGIYTDNQNYVSEGIVDTTGPKYIFLALDDYNNNLYNGFYSAFNSSLLNKNILARISLQSKMFDVLIQNNLSIVSTPREYFGPVNIQNLNVQLLDEYGRMIDLNNMDFSFCLTMTKVYDI